MKQDHFTCTKLWILFTIIISISPSYSRYMSLSGSINIVQANLYSLHCVQYQWGFLQLIFMVEPWGRHVKKAQIMWLLLLVANFSTNNNSFVCCFWNIIQVLKHEHIVLLLLLLSVLLWIKQVSFSLFLLQLFLTLFELFKILTQSHSYTYVLNTYICMY